MSAHFERAHLLLQQHRPEMAEAELRLALAEDPDAPEAHALLALCLSELERHTEATEEAQRAVSLAPDDSFSHYVHAAVLSGRDDYAAAGAAIAEAIRLLPEEPDYWGLLGGVRLSQKRWQDALDAAESGLRHDAEHEKCLNVRAIALVKLGRQAEAGRVLDVALRQNPDNTLTHANQGWALLEAGEPQKAMEHFREALRLEPNNEWARQGIVEALKARHFIYRWMLKYFLFMGKLSDKAAWAVIIGLYLGNRVIASLSKSHPAWAPYLQPILYLYLGFCLLTWLAYPLFNLLLRFNRFGRLALNRDQIRMSNALAVLLLGLAGALVWLGFSSNPVESVCAQETAWFFGLLMLPVTGVFHCEPGWPRRLMTFIAAILIGCGGTKLGLLFFATSTPENLTLFKTLHIVFMWGCVLSPWYLNFLAMVTPKKR
ncbi:MAG: tetratricopeptide repeat protein [Planctomycetes bacterium]|nr:tetratricopeptide repeat protein [Planctomycetota bacterium]